MSKPKVGDVVTMSGLSPLLTVNAIDSGYADCLWFDEEDQLHTGNFAMASLKVVDMEEMCKDCETETKTESTVKGGN